MDVKKAIDMQCMSSRSTVRRYAFLQVRQHPRLVVPPVCGTTVDTCCKFVTLRVDRDIASSKYAMLFRSTTKAYAVHPILHTRLFYSCAFPCLVEMNDIF